MASTHFLECYTHVSIILPHLFQCPKPLWMSSISGEVLVLPVLDFGYVSKLQKETLFHVMLYLVLFYSILFYVLFNVSFDNSDVTLIYTNMKQLQRLH